jgi:broad specificity phosphatase PhoE
VAQRLASEPLSAIYTSPRKRTIESAELVAASQTCGLRIENDLREIDFGDFEGLTYDNISKLYPGLYRQWMEQPTEVEFPNGESFTIMKSRVTKAVASLHDLHAGQSIALVTHGGAIRILLAETLSIPASNVFRIGQHYSALNLIRFLGNHPVVELMNG